MHACTTCAEDEISKELFPRKSSSGLFWENKMYKLKRSIYYYVSLFTCDGYSTQIVCSFAQEQFNCTQKDWISKSAIFFIVSFLEDGRLTTKTALQKLRI